MYESEMYLLKLRKDKLVNAPNWVGIVPSRLVTAVFRNVGRASKSEWKQYLDWCWTTKRKCMNQSEMYLPNSRWVKFVNAPNWVGISPVSLLWPVFGKVGRTPMSKWNQISSSAWAAQRKCMNQRCTYLNKDWSSLSMLPTELEWYHQDCLHLYLERLEGHQWVCGSNILIDVWQQRENVWIRDVLTKIKIRQACQCSQLSWNISSKLVSIYIWKGCKGIKKWVE